MKHFIACFICLATAQIGHSQITSRFLLDKIYSAIDGARRYTYVMKSEERFGSKMIKKEMLFKINESPKKIYMKDTKEGTELLYVKGWNENKAHINPNGFPWTNLNLSIYNAQVRKDNHHVVTTAGFAFTAKLLRFTEAEIAKNNAHIDTFFRIAEDVDHDGKKCHQFIMEYKDYTWKPYTLEKDEDLEALSLRLGVPEYAVKERNNLEYGKIRAGKTIQIPSAYAQKVVFYVDPKTYLPLVQILHDDKGVYERYEYKSIKINPSFPADEFTPQSASYGFQ